MRKTIALLFIAMFLVGVLPLAFADDADATNIEDLKDAERTAVGTGAKGIDDQAKTSIEALRQKQQERRAELIEAQKTRVEKLVQACVARGNDETKCNEIFGQRIEALQKLAPKIDAVSAVAMQQKRAEIMNRVKEAKGFEGLKQEFGFNARAIEKMKIEKARVNILQARERFMTLKTNLEKTKLRFEQAKQNRVCKENPESEDCQKARTELRLAAKEKLLGDAEAIIAHLQHIKSYVDASEAITDEEAVKIMAYLDEQIAKFESIKAEIQSAETKEQLVDVAKKLKEAWKEHRARVNAYALKLANSNMAGIIVKSAMLQAKLDRVLEKMQERGKDISVVNPLIDEFKAKLELAKTKFADAQNLFEAIHNGEAGVEKVKEAQDLMKEARTALQDASKLVRDIYLKLKEADALTELTEANEEETAVEESAEENATEEQAEVSA